MGVTGSTGLCGSFWHHEDIKSWAKGMETIQEAKEPLFHISSLEECPSLDVWARGITELERNIKN